ncbi:heparin lyase I family protein [Saccharopolyspora griseoalba]|uniref:Heparin lyase I family protein n=1 Tax=Saccharopolyspora griseoalba TaxID=1431848 RepID=A0ABW2LEP9_9PSEU
MKRSTFATLMAAFCLVPAAPAHAATIWDGDASKGTGVFGAVLCSDPASLTHQDDDGRGEVWKVNKPLGLERCEAHDIRVGGTEYAWREGAAYYLGWDTMTNTDDAGTIFHWKSNGTNDQHQQNYPVLIEVEGGVLKVFHIKVGERWTLAWSTPVERDTWKRVALGIHTSSDPSRGWVEVYYNGRQVHSFTGRTWDDLGNKPRWGSYGAEVVDNRVINWMDGMKVGTSYADVS